MTEPHHSTKSLLTKLKEFKSTPEPTATYKKRLYNIALAVEKDVLNNKSQAGYVQSSIERYKTDGRETEWIKSIIHAQNKYTQAHQQWLKASTDESVITRMERNAHVRATFFRLLTTLGVGFSIMFVYWVAHILCIPMPLMRIPL